MADLSERLVQLKTEKNLLQQDIAKDNNIPLRTYQRYERGESEPTSSTVAKLADYFGVSTDYLLGRVNHWHDAEGRIAVKVPPDIMNLDTEALKKQLDQD